jgi:hypothetical protein
MHALIAMRVSDTNTTTPFRPPWTCILTQFVYGRPLDVVYNRELTVPCRSGATGAGLGDKPFSPKRPERVSLDPRSKPKASTFFNMFRQSTSFCVVCSSLATGRRVRYCWLWRVLEIYTRCKAHTY